MSTMLVVVVLASSDNDAEGHQKRRSLSITIFTIMIGCTWTCR
jgi:hypothetical protein